MKLKHIVLPACLMAQSIALSAQDTAPDNWYNLDKATDKVQGVSTEKAYQELLKGKQSKTILVAVIDSGIDEEHEDLKDIMWVNEDEIPGNGIDDDKNGYVDDIYGWNFIGGANGENVKEDTYELTRVYKMLKDKKRNKKEEERYKKIKKEYDEKVNNAQLNLQQMELITSVAETLKEALDGQPSTIANIEAIESDDEKVKMAQKMFVTLFKPQYEAQGQDPKEPVDLDELIQSVQGAKDYYKNSLEYGYNVDFEPRKIVGDDYNNSKERYYGNNDVTGPDAGHGTHVAGIIGAVRTNNIGNMGVADNVRIMSVRAVPDGDERDKDVANAIYYAVDNGAKIINMSFGKGFSWDKKAVDKAVRYAEKKGVLLVHAAGNSALNTDIEDNYPNKYKKDNTSKPYSNWIEVGALSWKPDAEMPATFSNYGKKNVDVFAPGVDIYSTVPGSKYDSYSGTSMASPVTAGVAALVWSYYPDLTVKQLRQIITESTIKMNEYVILPGTSDKKVEFNTLCNTSGVVNAYKALEMAEKMSKG